MTDIGVIGGDEAAFILNELFSVHEEPTVRVKPINAETRLERFHILLINGSGHLAANFLQELADGGAVVVNTDDKAICNYLNGCRGRLITYGFSSKACVTASSVTDEAYESVQLCIQRHLPTLDGSTLEPQEFPISFSDTPKNIYCVLGAVAAALVAGLEIENF